MTKNSDYLDVVDENDKVIDKKTFEECHSKGLRHRSVHLEIYSDENKNKILIVRRSKDKLQNPEALEIPGGHVWAGESYAEAAVRDLKGELGLTIPLTQIAKEENNSGDTSTRITNREFVCVFEGIWNGDVKELKLDKNESTQAEWQPVDKVILLAKNAPTLVNSATRLYAKRQAVKKEQVERNK